MSGYQVGTRVGAIRNADKENVYLYGYGVYDGEQDPGHGPMGMPQEEWFSLLRERGVDPQPWLNPRITLDCGAVVWGFMCWWGPEDRIKASIGDRKIVMVEVEKAAT